MMTLMTLCWEFLKVGLFTVGGGLASLPFLEQMTRTHPDWFNMEMLGNMVAISESTPGPIGINMATYVGYLVSGVPGAILASLSLVLPSVVIVLLLSRVLDQFKDNRIVKCVFAALRAAVTGLIMAAGYSMLKMALYSGPASLSDLSAAWSGIQWISVLVFAALLGLLQVKRFKKLHPIVFIIAGALLGVLLRL